MRIFTYLFLFLPTFQMATADDSAQEYVRSAEDYILHGDTHQKNVEIGAGMAIEENPDVFPDITKEEGRAFVRETHDKSKTWKYGEKIHSYFGKGQHNLSSSDTKKLKALVREMNDWDLVRVEGYFRAHGWIDSEGNIHPKAQQLLRAEIIADSVDRSKNPISPSEFGRPMRPSAAFLKDPKDQEIATSLEKRYDKWAKKSDLHYRFVNRPGRFGQALSETELKGMSRSVPGGKGVVRFYYKLNAKDLKKARLELEGRKAILQRQIAEDKTTTQELTIKQKSISEIDQALKDLNTAPKLYAVKDVVVSDRNLTAANEFYAQLAKDNRKEVRMIKISSPEGRLLGKILPGVNLMLVGAGVAGAIALDGAETKSTTRTLVEGAR